MAVDGRGSQQSRSAAMHAALAAGQAFVEFDGARLFEQVDHGVAVGAEAEQPAPGEQRGCGPDAVAEVALGGGAEAHAGRGAVACRRCPRSVRWVACTAVVRGPSTPTSRISAVGVRPCTARHWSTSAVCSDEWTCSGASCARRPFDDGRHLLDGHRPDGMQCGADQDGGVGCDLLPQRLDAFGPRGRRCRRRTAAAARRQRCTVEPGTQIAGVEQGEPDTGVRGAVDQRRVPSRSDRRSGAPPASWCR